MHRSRIDGLLIDCKVDEIGLAAEFWATALVGPVDLKHAGTRGNYPMRKRRPMNSASRSNVWTTEAACTLMSRRMTFRPKSQGVNLLAPRDGFEPPTNGLTGRPTGGRRSIG
jgi:hypothetical protein